MNPTAPRVRYRAKRPRGLGLITDAMQPIGLGDGANVRPGNRRVIVRDGVVRLESGAGSGRTAQTCRTDADRAVC